VSQLVAYYDETPVEVRDTVEIDQSPMSSAPGTRSVDGVIRPSLVYGPVLLPARQP
jgi:hypothetical protein